MARRLTTNQEIPGSTPGVIIFAGLCHVKMVALKENFFVWFKEAQTSLSAVLSHRNSARPSRLPIETAVIVHTGFL